MGYQSTFTHDVWHREAATLTIRNGIRTRRWGMRVTVYDDPVAANNGDWVLSYSLVNTNRQSNLNWLKVADIGDVWGDASGGIVTADNGLTVTGTNLQLGGDLIQTTNIDGAQEFYIGDNTPLIIFDVVSNDISIAANTGDVDITAVNGVIGGFADTISFQTLTTSQNLDATTASMSAPGTTMSLHSTTGYTLTSSNPISLVANGAGDGNITLDAVNNIFLGNTTSSGSSRPITAQGSAASVGVTVRSKNAGQISLELGNGNAQIAARSIDILLNHTTGPLTSTTAGFTLNSTAAGTLNGNTGLTLNSSGGNINLNPVTGNFLLKGLAAGSPATEYFRGDGIWGLPTIGGQGESALISNPTATEDGFVVTWDDALGEYTLVAAGGGSITADNGLTETAGNIQLGGALIQNTTLPGAGFNLSFGTFASRINVSRTFATQLGLVGDDITIQADGVAGGINLSAPQTIVIQQTSDINSELLQILKQQTSNSGISGSIMRYTATTPGGSGVGFGMQWVSDLTTSAGPVRTLMEDELILTDPTSSSEFVTWSKELIVNGAMTEVMSIDTSSTAPNIFVTLHGLLILPDLPTSSAGLAAGSVWNNSGVLNIV